MVKITAKYTGQKHCELTHGPSGTVIGTDAPKDNNGRGEMFSPTDLVAGALGSCMLTIMGIVAERDGVVIDGATVEVTKEMTPPPRRIGRLAVQLSLPPGIRPDYRQKLENAAHTCPVHKSLHPDTMIDISFKYAD